MAPTILPSMMSGRPPSTGTAPCKARKRTPAPPAARMSCIALVGRLNRTEERALSCAMFTLATCVPSIFSKYTRSPAVSTMAIAILKPLLPASAIDVAAILLAVSRLTDAPYGFGSCANAGAAANTAAAITSIFRMLFGSRCAGGGPRRVDVVLRDGFARSENALLRVFRQRPIFGALGAQRVRHRIVAFEALVRQQLVAGRRDERQRDRERRRVRLRVVDFHFVTQFIGTDARDAFGHHHVLAVAQAVAV